MSKSTLYSWYRSSTSFLSTCMIMTFKIAITNSYQGKIIQGPHGCAVFALISVGVLLECNICHLADIPAKHIWRHAPVNLYESLTNFYFAILARIFSLSLLWTFLVQDLCIKMSKLWISNYFVQICLHLLLYVSILLEVVFESLHLGNDCEVSCAVGTAATKGTIVMVVLFTAICVLCLFSLTESTCPV